MSDKSIKKIRRWVNSEDYFSLEGCRVICFGENKMVLIEELWFYKNEVRDEERN